MTFEQVARLSLEPAVGPAGPRVLGLLALLVVAAVASVARGFSNLMSQATRPRLQPIPVEVPRRRAFPSRD